MLRNSVQCVRANGTRVTRTARVMSSLSVFSLVMPGKIANPGTLFFGNPFVACLELLQKKKKNTMGIRKKMLHNHKAFSMCG